MNARFDTMEPAAMAVYGGHIILTTREEAMPGPRAILYHDEYAECGPTVSLSILLQRCGVYGDDLVVGVDPGRRLGLSIFYAGLEVERSLHVSLESAVSHLCGILGRMTTMSRTIRVGNGDMRTAGMLCRMLYDAPLPAFRLELVDEAHTSPRSHNCNRRGIRDMLAARAIAQREGLTRRPY